MLIGVAKSMVFWPEMYLLQILVFQAVLISDLHLYYCEGICNNIISPQLCTSKNNNYYVWTSVIGTSITLSPLGTVSVCPGEQVLLTCERINGSFLYWTVSVPHMAMTRESIVPRQGAISTTLMSPVRLTTH